MNCLGCGRDTKHSTGYCYHCMSGRHMPSEKKGRAIFRFDGESPSDILTSGIDEDDYSEESMGPEKKPVHQPSPAEDQAQWKKRQRRENEAAGTEKGSEIGEAEK